MNGLILTLVSGLFFLIGIIIYKIVKHKKELTIISMSCAMIIIIGLIVIDLIPHLIEMNNFLLVIFVVIGLLFILFIDKFIPHHHHDHHENDEHTKSHQHHLEHIGIITILALLLHNFVEGMALYSVTMENLKSGILMCIGIGLHNLPFGFQIATYDEKTSNKALIVLLVFSGLLGGLTIYLFGNISHLVEGIIIAITLGMIIHILFFELCKEVWDNINKKETIYGIIIGILLLLVINLI